MQFFLSIVIWIILGTLTAHFANQRGRDPYIWFGIGLLLGILGLLLVFLLPSYDDEEDQEEVKSSVPGESLSFLPPGCRTLDWYYLLDGQEQIGPVSFDKIKDLSQSLEEDFYVWCEGMEDWERVSKLKGCGDEHTHRD